MPSVRCGEARRPRACTHDPSGALVEAEIREEGGRTVHVRARQAELRGDPVDVLGRDAAALGLRAAQPLEHLGGAAVEAALELDRRVAVLSHLRVGAGWAAGAVDFSSLPRR